MLPHRPNQNQLLAALPAAEQERLAPHLELIALAAGDVLYKLGGPRQYAFFPTSAVVSLLYATEDGSSSEIAVVGSEGLLGISVVLGDETTTSFAVVRTAGFAYRIKTPVLQGEFERAGPVLRLLLRYTQAMIMQMTQIAVCNRHHTIEQQLCRWLLVNLDRYHSDTLDITQAAIASTLGVRREGISEAASRLQRAGLIQYTRGHIQVVDRPGLERTVCECYLAVRKEFQRLLTETPANRAPYLANSVRR